MHFVITHHAAERYRKRIRPELDLQGAHEELSALAEGARRVREKSLKGQTRWTIPGGGLYLVTKNEPVDHAYVVVTVLSGDKEET